MRGRDTSRLIVKGLGDQLPTQTQTVGSPAPPPGAHGRPPPSPPPAGPQRAASVAVEPLPTGAASSGNLKAVSELAGRDVLDCPAHLIGDMPVPFSLRWLSPGPAPIGFWTTWYAEHYQSLRVMGAVVLGAREWAALVLGTRLDRASPVISQWLAMKAANPLCEITAELVIGGAVGAEATGTPTVGDVARAWSLSLEELVYGQT